MSTHLFFAPTAAGKTAWVIDHIRHAAANLRRSPLVVVATPLQANALRRRLAAAGGAIGVRVVTFDGLYAAILQLARVVYTELDEAVQYRLLRTVLDDLAAAGELIFYRNLVTRPGFIAAMEALLGELKGAGIRPVQLQAALAGLDAPPRLAELGAIYTRYQELLDANDWSDRPGVAWLALASLMAADMRLPAAWSPIYFDGFDSFTVVQRAVICALARKSEDLAVLLTGTVAGVTPSPYALFTETATLLAQELGVAPAPLPLTAGGIPGAAPQHALRPLAERLFLPHAPGDAPAAAPVTLLAAADRAGEVRGALRWLKQCIVLDGMQPNELVLLARNAPAYRDLVTQTAAEFGMSVHSDDHLPLASNPAVSALVDLLHLMVADPRGGQPLLPRRGVVEAWRSPYFRWVDPEGVPGEGPGITAGDAAALDAFARDYLVIRGLAQWRESFALAQAREAPADDGSGRAGVQIAEVHDAPDDTERNRLNVTELVLRFERFVACLAPPEGAPLRDYVCWLEDLVGPDPDLQRASPTPFAMMGETVARDFTLDMVACIRDGDAALHGRDIAAVCRLKDVLGGLVWADEAVAGARGRAGADAPLDYSRFLAELVGAVTAATYEPVAERSRSILLTDLHSARGVSFRAAAIVGLAEGELPRRRSEDPFLRNADRRQLRSLGLPLEDSTRSFEREAFYTSVARARAQLLLCRPRMAENGVPWEPSPYWLVVERLLGIHETTIPGEYRPALAEAASLPELVESALLRPQVAAWLDVHQGDVVARLQHAAVLVAARTVRYYRRSPSVFDGFLGDHPTCRETLAGRLQHWSPSRLERYRACPYWFYLSYVLQLEQRTEPEEGVNFAQAGNLYHRIFERVYSSVDDPTSAEQLLAALPAVAKSVLDAAPEQEGFRVTAWWAQTRAEIEANVADSLTALAAYDGVPSAFEQYFGKDKPLRVVLGDIAFTVSGKIDRIDVRPDGSLRIIDYKTGVTEYDSAKALLEGRRLQLALYALAAQDALRLGPVSDGFYWFAHKARSSWAMAEFQDPATGATGPAAAIEIALAHAAAAVDGARRGEYAPQPPDLGCPDYCTAAAFCWHYRSKYTG